MCDYTQREYSCGHFRWIASKWCREYTTTHKRCQPNVTHFEYRAEELCGMSYSPWMSHSPRNQTLILLISRRVQAERVPAMGAPDQAPQAADLLGSLGHGAGQRSVPGTNIALSPVSDTFVFPQSCPVHLHDEGYRKRLTCWYMTTQCNGWRVYAKLSVHIGVQTACSMRTCLPVYSLDRT